jgi:hypothetical protein
MMKKTTGLLTLFMIFFNLSYGQVKKEPADKRPDIFDYIDSVARVNHYDFHAAFGPGFYTSNGNEYRAASGEPGPKYWQNRANYQLDVKLDETKK